MHILIGIFLNGSCFCLILIGMFVVNLQGQNLGNLSVSTHSELLREEQRFNKYVTCIGHFYDMFDETSDFVLQYFC